MVQPTVTEDGEKAPALKFGQPRVMALPLALTLFHHLIDGFIIAILSFGLLILLGDSKSRCNPIFIRCGECRCIAYRRGAPR